ncbi:MAG: hypothetical protein M0P31_13570 [Solirubrobacteraceae bacterium]|nr:hypothetical protein [Solirubrobacteraceae bacterium]
MTVRVGQVWASNTKSDRERGVRQHRTVIEILEHGAVLEHRGIRGQLLTSSLLISNDRIAGHRLVRDAGELS